eukprot:scaffold436_cov336-Pavlova_lutheri.AAC.20
MGMTFRPSQCHSPQSVCCVRGFALASSHVIHHPASIGPPSLYPGLPLPPSSHLGPWWIGCHHRLGMVRSRGPSPTHPRWVGRGESVGSPGRMFRPRMAGKYGRYPRMKQGRRNAFGTGDKGQTGQRQNSTSKGPREQAVTNGHVLPGSDKRSDATARIRQTSNTSMPGRTGHELVHCELPCVIISGISRKAVLCSEGFVSHPARIHLACLPTIFHHECRGCEAFTCSFFFEALGACIFARVQASVLLTGERTSLHNPGGRSTFIDPGVALAFPRQRRTVAKLVWLAELLCTQPVRAQSEEEERRPGASHNLPLRPLVRELLVFDHDVHRLVLFVDAVMSTPSSSPFESTVPVSLEGSLPSRIGRPHPVLPGWRNANRGTKG